MRFDKACLLVPTGVVACVRFLVPGPPACGYASVQGCLGLVDPDKFDGVSGRFSRRSEGGYEGSDSGLVITDESKLMVSVACNGEWP